jgi:hypothetical protein
MSSSRVRLFAASILLVAGACGGGGDEGGGGGQGGESSGGETTVVANPEPPPPPPPRPSHVRVLHLAAGAAGATLTATAGTEDAPVGQIPDIAFAAGGAYLEVPMPGDTLTLPVSIAAGEQSASLEAPLRAGVPATLIVVSDEAGTGVQLVPTEDEALGVTAQPRARFVNAMHGVPSVDFCLPGETAREPGRTIFANVAYGVVAGTETPAHYIPIPSTGELRMQVRQSGAEGSQPCRGRVLGAALIPPPDGSTTHNVTLAVVGRMRGRPAVPRQLVVCEDMPGNGSCTALPLQ